VASVGRGERPTDSLEGNLRHDTVVYRLNNKDKVADVENEYANLKMRIGESPLDYKLRLDEILQRLIAVGVDVENIATYSEEMQATRSCQIW